MELITCPVCEGDVLRDENLICVNCKGKGEVKPNQPVYRTRVIERILTEVFCPKCRHLLEEVTDKDAKTLMTYKCNKCNYCH